METKNTTLPPGVEIFAAGRRTADNGTTYDFSDADIDAIAASYNPAVREAPLVVGHPAANLPAYGWVSKLGSLLGSAGKILKMDSRDVEPAFAEMVRNKRFPKRSASFYHPTHPNNPTPGKWYLRHVGFLGAQPPAVAGLKDIDFSEQEDAGAVCFSELPTGTPIQEISTMNDEEKARLAAAEKEAADAKAAQAKAEKAAKEAADQLAQFAEQQTAARHEANVSFCEKAVEEGRILPAEKATAVAVLDALAGAEPVSFSEGDTTRQINMGEWVKSRIAGAKPVVDFGEFAGASVGGESTKGLSDAEIDKRAKAHAAKHNVSYSDALTAVVNFTA